MRFLITGSRDASKSMLSKADEVVAWCAKEGHSLIVGDAPGVDRRVRQQALVNKVPVKVYGAYGKIREPGIGGNWEKRFYTKGTYPERDIVMARECDMCVAVWNGTSRGTKITFEAARRLGKIVHVRKFN